MTKVLTNDRLDHVLSLGNLDVAIMEELHLESMELDYISKGAFKSLVKVRGIHLADNRLKEISKKLFGNKISPLIVHFLDLTSNQIENFNFLSQFQNLSTLKLSGNNLVELPSGMGEMLPNLKDLVLSNNLLTTVSFGSSFSNLETLILSGNQLRNIKSLELPNLRKLTAIKNNLEDFPVLDSCSQLTELRLSRNKIKKLKVKTLESLPLLQTLDLGNNAFDTAEDLADFHSLDLCKDLRSVSFERNPFTVGLFKNKYVYIGAFLNGPLRASSKLESFDFKPIASIRKRLSGRDEEEKMLVNKSLLLFGNTQPDEKVIEKVIEKKEKEKQPNPSVVVGEDIDVPLAPVAFQVVEEEIKEKKTKKRKKDKEDQVHIWDTKRKIASW